MTPVTPRYRRSPYLHPRSAYSGRSSRRSSASTSWAEGRMNVQSQLSDLSIPLPPASQTSDSVHQSALDESGRLHTLALQDSSGSYFWGDADGASIPGTDSSYPADNQSLFPPINQDSTAPSPNPFPDDEILNPNMPLNDSESRLQFILRTIQFNYTHHSNQEAYVSELARLNLDNQTLGRYQILAQQNLNTGPEPHAPPNPPARSTSYRCLMCNPSQIFQETAFGRHVNEQHQVKSYFYCGVCEGFKSPRRHRLKEHLLNVHSRRASKQQISRCELMEPAPLVCNICVSQGLQYHPGPFPSWRYWFNGIKSHCRIQEQTTPPPALPQFFSGYDGGGAGGYGGATGHGSASHGASPGGFSSFTGSDYGMGAPWSGASYYCPTSSRSAVPIDTSANRLNCSDIKPTQDATSNDLNNDVDSNQNSKQLFRDLNISQRGRDNKGTGVSKGCCSRCNHEYDSCPACPQKHTPGYCHLCNGLTTAVGADHKSQSDEVENPPLERLVRGLSKLSLECQQTVPKSDVSSKQALSSLLKSVYRNNTVGAAQQWPCMTIRLIPAAVNEFNPMYCLVVSISRLSLESSYMSQLMRMDNYPKITVDALMTGQKMLKNIHENPPGSSAKLVKQISRCQTALDAIGSEMSTPSQYTAAQKARQKRLSSLWARLRAVTFVLALQKEVITDEIQEERPLDENSQLTLLNTIGKKIPPLAELGSLYQLVHKHLYGDFWASSGLLEAINQNTKKSAIEDSSRVCTFLRALVTSISDPKWSFLKEYAASELSAFIEDIF